MHSVSAEASTSSLFEIQHIDFEVNGFIRITEFLNFISFEQLTNEAYALLNQHKLRRSFKMKETSFTPRTMYNVKQSVIKQDGDYIPRLYHSPEIKKLIHQISRETVYDLPFEEERYLINCISEIGDTHGWHWDDYSYSIVFILKAPRLENGGLVQCIPHTKWSREKDAVNKILCDHPIHTYFFKENEAYLLKSNTTMHRVMPLSQPDFRLSINMSWASQSDLDRIIDHSTMEKLYE